MELWSTSPYKCFLLLREQYTFVQFTTVDKSSVVLCLYFKLGKLPLETCLCASRPVSRHWVLFISLFCFVFFTIFQWKHSNISNSNTPSESAHKTFSACQNTDTPCILNNCSCSSLQDVLSLYWIHLHCDRCCFASSRAWNVEWQIIKSSKNIFQCYSEDGKGKQMTTEWEPSEWHSWQSRLLAVWRRSRLSQSWQHRTQSFQVSLILNRGEITFKDQTGSLYNENSITILDSSKD